MYDPTPQQKIAPFAGASFNVKRASFPHYSLCRLRTKIQEPHDRSIDDFNFRSTEAIQIREVTRIDKAPISTPCCMLLRLARER